MYMAKRVSEYPVDSLFMNRWSPRALSGESIPDTVLMSLFEAARWAPSSYNNQPWQFVYAKRNTQYWDHLFNLLNGGNQVWAKNAAVLLVVISQNFFTLNNKPSRTHSFDAGAAVQNLALQAHILGLVAHGMEGFDYARAKKELAIPDTYTVEAMFAIGKPGVKENLPPELQKREEPSTRKPVKDFIFEGTFKK
jgi:nitroreductase